MFETIDRVLLAGLGAMSMTRERAERIFDEFVSKGQEARGDKSGFVKEMMDSADRTRAELERIVREQVHAVVDTLELATKEDLQSVEAKLDKIEKQLKKGQ